MMQMSELGSTRTWRYGIAFLLAALAAFLVCSGRMIGPISPMNALLGYILAGGCAVVGAYLIAVSTYRKRD
jgi:hypothetical protein